MMQRQGGRLLSTDLVAPKRLTRCFPNDAKMALQPKMLETKLTRWPFDCLGMIGGPLDQPQSWMIQVGPLEHSPSHEHWRLGC